MSTKLVIATTVFVAVSIADIVDARKTRKEVMSAEILLPGIGKDVVNDKVSKRIIRQIAFNGINMVAGRVLGSEIVKLIAK